MNTLKNKTLSEQFADDFGLDGQTFTSEKGIDIENLLSGCKKEYGIGEDWDCVRYVFNDNSAIVISGGAWDVEGSKPFTMQECELAEKR